MDELKKHAKIVGKIKGERNVRILFQWGEDIEDMESRERFGVHQLCDDYVKCKNAFDALALRETFFFEQAYCNHYETLCSDVLEDATHCKDRCKNCVDVELLDICLLPKETRT